MLIIHSVNKTSLITINVTEHQHAPNIFFDYVTSGTRWKHSFHKLISIALWFIRFSSRTQHENKNQSFSSFHNKRLISVRRLLIPSAVAMWITDWLFKFHLKVIQPFISFFLVPFCHLRLNNSQHIFLWCSGDVSGIHVLALNTIFRWLRLRFPWLLNPPT